MDEAGGAGPPLAGRRALVVGGTGGLGLAVARGLARRGASLLLHGGSSREGLEASLADCAGLSRAAGLRPEQARHEGLLLPIERPSAFLGSLGDPGSFDILCVAYGPFLQKPLHAMTAPEWESLALLDLALPGLLASALLPGMIGRGWGRLLFFGGTRTDAIRSYATNAAYAAAKTGLGVLVKSLAAEYGAAGIGAFALCPGLVDTEYLSPGLRSSLAAKAPGGRLLDPATIGDFAAQLAAAEPCFASGAIINLDAGLKF